MLDIEGLCDLLCSLALATRESDVGLGRKRYKLYFRKGDSDTDVGTDQAGIKSRAEAMRSSPGRVDEARTRPVAAELRGEARFGKRW